MFLSHGGTTRVVLAAQNLLQEEESSSAWQSSLCCAYKARSRPVHTILSTEQPVSCFFFLYSKHHRVFNLCSKPRLAGLEMDGVGCSNTLEPPLFHIYWFCLSHVRGMQHRLIKNEIMTWTSFFLLGKTNVFIQTVSGIQCLCVFWDSTLLSFK